MLPCTPTKTWGLRLKGNPKNKIFGMMVVPICFPLGMEIDGFEWVERICDVNPDKYDPEAPSFLRSEG